MVNEGFDEVKVVEDTAIGMSLGSREGVDASGKDVMLLDSLWTLRSLCDALGRQNNRLTARMQREIDYFM